MTQCVVLLCLSIFVILHATVHEDENDTKKTRSDYTDDLDYSDIGSGDIDLDDLESLLTPNSTETNIDHWPSRRSITPKRVKQRIWKVIRREVRDMKNFLPTLANNISWMDLDVKDMNKNFFSLVGDIRVIKSEVMMIKKLAHTIWQNVTDTRRDHKQMNKTLWWILNNVTIVIDDVEKTVKYITDMSTAYGTVTKKLEAAVESMSSEFGQIKTTLKSDFDQINNDMKTLSEIVMKMSHAVFEIRDNVSRLFPRKDDAVPADVSAISLGIASQSQLINAISNSVGDMTNDILQATRRIEEIGMLVNTLREHIDVVGERMLVVNHNISRVRDGMLMVDEKVSLIGSNITDINRQLSYLGSNVTAINGQFGGLSRTLSSMHNSFDEVGSHLGVMHERIITDVGSIRGDIRDMKVQLRDMRGVIAEKCEASCAKVHDSRNCGDNNCLPTNNLGIGDEFNLGEYPRHDFSSDPLAASRPDQSNSDFHSPGEYPKITPEPGRPTTGYPTSLPQDIRPTSGYPPAPQDIRPTPGYPMPPPQDTQPPPRYPPSPQDIRPTSGYPPSPQDTQPPARYPPTAQDIRPTPGYPPSPQDTQPPPGYPPPGYPPPGYPPSGYPPPAQDTKPPPRYPPSPQDIQPIPGYPLPPPQDNPPIPGYPMPPPQDNPPIPGYPMPPPHDNPPISGYPMPPPQATHPTPGYPGYPHHPRPGHPPGSHIPFHPTPDYPTTTPQPPHPQTSEYPTTAIYPHTTVFVPYPGYPTGRPTEYHYPHPTTPYPHLYPTTIVYPSPFPSSTFYPVTTGYPPMAEYPISSSAPTGAPTPPSTPTKPTTPREYDENNNPRTGVEISQHSSGLPIGCADEFTGLCACTCPCDCTCPMVERGILPSHSSARFKFPSPGRDQCECVCPCPCGARVASIVTSSKPPAQPQHRPAEPVDNSWCDRKLMEDLIREVRGLVRKTEEVGNTITMESRKTRHDILDEVDKKFDEFGQDLRIILEANLNLVTDTHNITFTLQDMKRAIFEEINQIVWVIQAVGVDIIQAIFKIMHGGDSNGNAYTDQQQVIRPPVRPGGPPPGLVAPGQPQSPRMDRPGPYHRPPAHLGGMRPGRSQGNRPSGRSAGKTGRRRPDRRMEKLEPPIQPTSTSSLTTLANDNSWTDPAGIQQNGTSSTTTETNQVSAVALRLLPNDATANSSGIVKKSSKKVKKKQGKDCSTTESQTKSESRSSHVRTSKKNGYHENSVGGQVDRSLERDDEGYDVEIVPDDLVEELDSEATVPEDKLGIMEEPMDPFAFHSMIQKHINKQWMKSVPRGSGDHRRKKKRRSRKRGRTRNRYRIVPRPLFPAMPSFPFAPLPISMAPSIPRPLRIRTPRIPAYPPIRSLPDVLSSLPHRINGLPYSASYNDGKGTSWNVNVNRRSNNGGVSASDGDVVDTLRKEIEHKDEDANVGDGENLTEGLQETDEQNENVVSRESEDDDRDEDDNSAAEEEEDEVQTERSSKEDDETDESTEHE